MKKTALTEQRIQSVRDHKRIALRWFRVLAAGLFVLSTAACSWVENVPSASVNVPGTPGGNGGGGGGGGDTGGGSISGPVFYTALWEPSPSAGIAGYQLNIDDLLGGSHREIDIPVSAALAMPGNRLGYGVPLEVDGNYILTLRAYSDGATSQPSNAIVVYGDSLAASAARAAAPQTAFASAPAAAMAGGSALATDLDHSLSADDSARSADAPSVDTLSTDATQSTAAATASGTESIASAGARLHSLEFDGGGTHLVGDAAAHVDATALTISSWVRPFSANSAGRRSLLVVRNATGHDRVEIAVTDGTDVSVVFRDDTGQVLASADFATVLERDVWQHMALVIDPSAEAAFALHVAGSVVTGGNFSTTLAQTLPVIDGSLTLGGLDGNSFAGRLGHTSIFERALGDAVIEQIDVAGHEIDLRTGLASDAAAAGLIHYWRMGENAGIEADLGASDWPVDLGVTGNGIYVVDDAPLSL